MAAVANFCGCSSTRIPTGHAVPPRVTKRRFSCRAAGGKKPEEESREILTAFFFGKAFADAVNDRVTSALGEILGDLGRKQAQQQKDIRQFQEEVETRAKESMAQSTNSPSADSSSQTDLYR